MYISCYYPVLQTHGHLVCCCIVPLWGSVSNASTGENTWRYSMGPCATNVALCIVWHILHTMSFRFLDTHCSACTASNVDCFLYYRIDQKHGRANGGALKCSFSITSAFSYRWSVEHITLLNFLTFPMTGIICLDGKYPVLRNMTNLKYLVLQLLH